MMKKLLLTLVLVLMWSVPSFAGGSIDWTLTALNTSTYVAIEIPSHSACGKVTIVASDRSKVYLAKDSSGTDVISMEEDESLDWGGVCSDYGTTTLFFAKSAAGTPSLVVLFVSE